MFKMQGSAFLGPDSTILGASLNLLGPDSQILVARFSVLGPDSQTLGVRPFVLWSRSLNFRC